MTNPGPNDPGGATAPPEDSTLVDGSRQLVDGGSSGTDDGPGGVPSALTGVDKRGDEVPKVDPTTHPGSKVAAEDDQLSPGDASSPISGSSSRGESAASGQLPAERQGR